MHQHFQKHELIFLVGLDFDHKNMLCLVFVSSIYIYVCDIQMYLDLLRLWNKISEENLALFEILHILLNLL